VSVYSRQLPDSAQCAGRRTPNRADDSTVHESSGGTSHGAHRAIDARGVRLERATARRSSPQLVSARVSSPALASARQRLPPLAAARAD